MDLERRGRLKSLTQWILWSGYFQPHLMVCSFPTRVKRRYDSQKLVSLWITLRRTTPPSTPRRVCDRHLNKGCLLRHPTLTVDRLVYRRVYDRVMVVLRLGFPLCTGSRRDDNWYVLATVVSNFTRIRRWKGTFRIWKECHQDG